MEAQVDVITGKRTILSYVTAPITATLQEAFTEQYGLYQDDNQFSANYDPQRTEFYFVLIPRT